MELRFVSPELSALDALKSEALACTVWQDVHPCDGVAALCDWRLAGTVSTLQIQGFLQGKLGEVLLIPGRPRMSFDKLLIFGAGPRDQFDDACFEHLIQHMLKTLQGLCAPSPVVQLPGRHGGLISAVRAAQKLIEAAGKSSERVEQDSWTLIEDGESRRRIEQYMLDEQRRVRRNR